MKRPVKTGIHTERILALSVLSAFKPFEILVICASLSSLASFAFISTTLSILLALGTFFTGFAALYVAFRIRIDAVMV
jgi:uncharacterized membrane protein